jgi:hypothetical protein
MIGSALKRWRRSSWAAYLKLLRSTDWPILVGPWHSEVGFEVLYWIPFLQALGLEPERLIPVTRGGAGAWYGVPTGIELYHLRTPRQVRVENIRNLHATDSLKQKAVTAWDRAVLKDAAAKIGAKHYHVLHPAWMYQTLTPYWEGHKGLEWLWPRLLQSETTKEGRKLTLNPIPGLNLPPGLELPKKFVAARFYVRATFPHHEATLMTAKATIAQSAAHMPVILLDAGVHADEHMDIPIRHVPNVYKLSDLYPGITPENNLAVQTSVLARAMGFLGTYGGLAQLALRMGKPSVSFYLEWSGTALAHKHLADAIATAARVPTLVVRINEVPLLRSVLPALEMLTQQGQPSSSAPAEQQPIEAVG